MDPKLRFFKKVRITTGCWEWLGALQGSGYGVFWMNRRQDWQKEYKERVSQESKS
jgi:hypothetical protein